MATILPTQRLFDKEIPQDFGNAEYRQERAFLIATHDLITQCGLERPVIAWFLDVAYVNKAISVFGTNSSAELTENERFKIHLQAVQTLRMAILRKRLTLSLRKFSLALSHSDLYKWFCGINRFALPEVPGKSAIGELENSLPPALIEEVERRLFQVVQDKESNLFREPIDFGQCYFDCTCIGANIHHPVDWILLRDATRTLMKAVARIRKAGLRHRMGDEPSVFITKMNRLSMEMTFAQRQKEAKRLRKGVFRKMKKVMKTVCDHAFNHLKLLEEKWETTELSRPQTEQILQQITPVTGKLSAAIRNAHERIIGGRPVANDEKILSLYEDDVHVIVRRKADAEVEFGNTLYLAEQADGLIVDWKFFRDQAPSDSKMLQGSHERMVDRLGVKVKLMAGDRGFDSRANRKYMENRDIFNAVCPRNPSLMAERLEELEFRKAQNRRSQTEARISIVSHCFCGSPMKQKGFENRQVHLGLSILSHNLWVLARLRIAEEKARSLAA
jgi:hypothetical protein